MISKKQAFQYARRSGQTHNLHVFDIDQVIDHIYEELEASYCSNCAKLTVSELPGFHWCTKHDCQIVSPEIVQCPTHEKESE